MDASKNENMALDLNGSWHDAIMLERGKCKKICYDMRSLKSPEKVRTRYGIPTDEKILAFCKGTLPLLGITEEGTIFTDQAVYFRPEAKKVDGSIQTHIPYRNLDGYLITQDGHKEGVYVFTLTDKLSVYRSTVFSKNIAGQEVKGLLRKLQNLLIEKNPTSDNALKKISAALLEKTKKDMGITPLAGDNSAILNAVIELGQLADEAAMVKAEYLYRQFQPEAYTQFVQTLPHCISDAVRTKIERVPTSFEVNYKKMLADYNLEFPRGDMNHIYERLHDIVDKDRDTYLIEMYFEIRLNQYCQPDFEMSCLRKKYGDKTANGLELFRCRLSYHRMYRVYNTIKENGIPSKDCFEFRDGLGLTPLHYAILLKNEAAVDALLKKGKWEIATPYQADEPFTKLFDYIISASGKQLSNLSDILMGTHKETIEIKNRIRSVKLTLFLQNTNYQINDTARFSEGIKYKLRKGRHATQDELNKISNNIRKLRESSNACWDKVQQSVELLEEYEREILLVMEDAISEALEFLSEMKDSDDPFYKYIYRIYFEPDFFEQVLFAIEENKGVHLYEYQGFYFIAPECAEVELPVQEVTEEEGVPEEPFDTQTPSGAPLYGNSWFSHGAHRNPDLLRVEYRKLVKQYHPDVSRVNNGEEIFKSIQTEYDQIKAQKS